MNTREARLGADILRLVEDFQRQPKEHPRSHPLLRSAATTLAAVVLASLAHRLAESRALRLASVATGAYLKHRADTSAHRTTDDESGSPR